MVKLGEDAKELPNLPPSMAIPLTRATPGQRRSPSGFFRVSRGRVSSVAAVEPPSDGWVLRSAATTPTGLAGTRARGVIVVRVYFLCLQVVCCARDGVSDIVSGIRVAYYWLSIVCQCACVRLPVYEGTGMCV